MSVAKITLEYNIKRTYTQKVFQLDDGNLLYRCHIAHKHFKDIKGDFQDIDTTLVFDGTNWWHNKASYNPTLPLYADGVFEFYNNLIFVFIVYEFYNIKII